jgi:hypothetical protein
MPKSLQDVLDEQKRQMSEMLARQHVPATDLHHDEAPIPGWRKYADGVSAPVMSAEEREAIERNPELAALRREFIKGIHKLRGGVSATMGGSEFVLALVVAIPISGFFLGAIAGGVICDASVPYAKHFECFDRTIPLCWVIAMLALVALSIKAHRRAFRNQRAYEERLENLPLHHLIAHGNRLKEETQEKARADYLAHQIGEAVARKLRRLE